MGPAGSELATSGEPIHTNNQWKSPWVTATAVIVRKSPNRVPLKNVVSGSAMMSVATRAKMVGVFPPAIMCESAATSTATPAITSPRATRVARVGVALGFTTFSIGIGRCEDPHITFSAKAPADLSGRFPVEWAPVSDVNPISSAEVDAAVDAALAAIASAGSTADLKSVRTQHLGEASAIAQLNGKMREVPKELKAETGKLMGQARGRLEGAFKRREAEVLEAEAAQRLIDETVDVTAAPQRVRIATRHPLALLQDEISDIFVGMGWEVAEGPELEHEWYNFDALNFEPDHPARAMQDTFFVEPANRHLILRTHTSPVQIRSLLARELPVYVIAPGRVYRTDELDATHTPVFHQIEGIAIDRGLTMAHLRGTLEHFARQMFGDEAKIRLRANFFPFTEPSAELDVWHPGAKGGARWVEWGGCGMVDPNVLLAAGIDPEEYQGFAFGMGIERTLQFRHDISDMRDMVEGDVRWGAQFGGLV